METRNAPWVPPGHFSDENRGLPTSDLNCDTDSNTNSIILNTNSLFFLKSAPLYRFLQFSVGLRDSWKSPFIRLDTNKFDYNQWFYPYPRKKTNLGESLAESHAHNPIRDFSRSPSVTQSLASDYMHDSLQDSLWDLFFLRGYTHDSLTINLSIIDNGLIAKLITGNISSKQKKLLNLRISSSNCSNLEASTLIECSSLGMNCPSYSKLILKFSRLPHMNAHI